MVRAVFGLENQGHIPTIQRMLSEGKSWGDIGLAIGWHGPTARDYYADYVWEHASTRERDVLLALTVLELPANLVHVEPAGKDVMFSGKTTRVAPVSHYNEGENLDSVRIMMLDRGWLSRVTYDENGVSAWFERKLPEDASVALVDYRASFSAVSSQSRLDEGAVVCKAAYIAWVKMTGRVR